jgi:hypothetical protein
MTASRMEDDDLDHQDSVRRSPQARRRPQAKAPRSAS